MASSEAHRRKVLVITRRLIVFAGISVLATAAVFGLSMTDFFRHRLLVSWITFECGLIGGFVSIQQRLHKIKDEELFLLTESWAAILIIPIYGGIFALVLYVLFLSGLVQGHLFPAFYIPTFSDAPTSENIRAFLTETYPKTGADFAKVLFWAFAAGFSERLVPQIISRISEKGGNEEVRSSEGGLGGD